MACSWYRQVGQDEACSSHVSRHCAWNICPHSNLLSLWPTLSGSTHTAHSGRHSAASITLQKTENAFRLNLSDVCPEPVLVD